MTNKYQDLYYTVKKNNKLFEKALDLLDEIRSEDKKIEVAKDILHYAVYNHTGNFYCSKLEKLFNDYGAKHNLKNNNIKYEPNSFLHVMTTAYKTGGHTRVVERWIEQSENTQKHSVIFTSQNLPLPERLIKAVTDKNGEIIKQDYNKTLLDRALELRKLAMQYEHIILHIHMDDPIANIAFGNNEFKRPIILFNHSDHTFWIGNSIADCVADIRVNNNLSRDKRLLNNSFMLGIPSEKQYKKEEPKEEKTKDEIRKDLNIPANKKIILTVGAPQKYKAISGDCIQPKLLKIIENVKDSICYAIGPTLKDEKWNEYYKLSGKRIVPLGIVDYSCKYWDYIKIADLIVDSYPAGGGTFLIDAIIHKKPLTCLASPLGQCDYIIKAQAFCSSEDEFINKSIKALNDIEYANMLSQELQENLEKYSSPQLWLNNLSNMYKSLPKQHRVYLKEQIPPSINDYAVALNALYNQNFNKKNPIKYVKYHFKYFIYRYILKNPTKAIRALLKY